MMNDLAYWSVAKEEKNGIMGKSYINKLTGMGTNHAYLSILH